MASTGSNPRTPPRFQTRVGGRLSTLGAAIGDPSRADILGVLASGRAHTAGELARWAGIAPSTTSKHLSRLVDAGLVVVEPSGRHRYFRIASEEVAELLERIDAVDLAEVDSPARPKPGSDLTFARSCYDHLAGELGVRLYRALIQRDLLTEVDQHPVLTDAGHAHFTELGIDTSDLASRRRPLAKRCLDWTERRHHLGGGLGSALLTHMLERNWLRPGRDRRIIQVAPEGHSALPQHFGIITGRG